MERKLSKARTEWICSPQPGAPESHCCGQGRMCDGKQGSGLCRGIEGKQMLRGCSVLAVWFCFAFPSPEQLWEHRQTPSLAMQQSFCHMTLDLKNPKPIETEQVCPAPQSPLSPRASSTPALDKILPPALQPQEQLFLCQSSSPSSSPFLRISSCLWICATSCWGDLLTAKPLHLLCSCSAKSGTFPCVLAGLSRGTKLAALQSPSWPEGLALPSQLEQLFLASNYNSML